MCFLSYSVNVYTVKKNHYMEIKKGENESKCRLVGRTLGDIFSSIFSIYIFFFFGTMNVYWLVFENIKAKSFKNF